MIADRAAAPCDPFDCHEHLLRIVDNANALARWLDASGQHTAGDGVRQIATDVLAARDRCAIECAREEPETERRQRRSVAAAQAYAARRLRRCARCHCDGRGEASYNDVSFKSWLGDDVTLRCYCECHLAQRDAP